MGFVVIECGSLWLRGLYVGDDGKRTEYTMPCRVARPGKKLAKEAEKMGYKTIYCGEEAFGGKGNVLVVSRPIKKRKIVDFEGLVECWKEMVRILKASKGGEAILIADQDGNDWSRMRALFLEEVWPGARNVFVQSQAFFAMFKSQRESGVVVDFGWEKTRVVAVENGNMQNFLEIPFGGRDVSLRLMELLNKRGYSFFEKDLECLEFMKEKLALVEPDVLRISQDPNYAYSLERQYELPDGQVIDLETERVLCFLDFYQPDALLAANLTPWSMIIPWSIQRLVWLGLKDWLLPDLIRMIIRMCKTRVPTLQSMILQVSSRNEKLLENVVVHGGPGNINQLENMLVAALGGREKVRVIFPSVVSAALEGAALYCKKIRQTSL